jgi:para-nitrobenzyl esterase
VRDALHHGANAPQILRAFPGLDITPLVGHGWQRGDDFLTLNIWAPAAAARPAAVLVFIHGGAFVAGSSDAAVHDGLEFARSGLVYVAINYRLGVEGFLAVEGAPTNLGLRDQLAALRWVQENIAAFGGDADRVTVAGESAGAISVACLLASPLSKGLFRRAVVQSGHGSMVREISIAARVTERLAQQLGVAAERASLRQCSLEACCAALDAISRPEVKIDLRDRDGRDPGYGLTRFLPVVGDDLLPQPPLTALAQGAGADIDLLIGTNREEMNLYFVPSGVRELMDARAAQHMLSASHPRAAELLAAYAGASPGIAFTDALTDLVFRLPARRYAAAHPGTTHLYEFGWRSPACAGQLGACHGLELPFVFNTLRACSGAAAIAGDDPPAALASDIHRLWVEFVTRGDLPWPRYDRDTRACMALEAGAARPDPEIRAAALDS